MNVFKNSNFKIDINNISNIKGIKENKYFRIFQQFKKEQKIIILLIIIFFSLYVIFYIIPYSFLFIFNSLLGNILLLLIGIFILSNKKYYIFIVYLFIILIIIRLLYINKTKEYFDTNKNNIWYDDNINEFKRRFKLTHPDILVDFEQIKKVSSPQDLDYYLQNGYWPWSDDVKNMYKEYLSNNTFIANFPEDGLNEAMKIYSQGQILQILSMQSKEGQFLLNGIFIGNNKDINDTNNYLSSIISGLQNKAQSIIRCGIDGMPKEIIPKFNGLYGSQPREYKTIYDFSELERKIPGFRFINEPCNPCNALKDPPDYSCKFQLNISESNKNKSKFIDSSAFPNSGTSKVWSYLWNI